MNGETKREFTIDDFFAIIRRLRGRDGCPWDREQTHESLRSCAMEEAAELSYSIRLYQKTGYADNMLEELGDLLLQVAMHSAMAEEEGLFAWEDVVREISLKMIRRHPHVFGGTQVSDTGEVLRNWEEIKKQEKAGKEHKLALLKDIPQELPALARAEKVLKKADRLYGGSEDEESSIEKLESAVGKLKNSMYKRGATLEQLKTAGNRMDKDADRDSISEALGDILMAVSNIGRHTGIALEQLLADRTEDFIESCEGEDKQFPSV